MRHKYILVSDDIIAPPHLEIFPLLPLGGVGIPVEREANNLLSGSPPVTVQTAGGVSRFTQLGHLGQDSSVTAALGDVARPLLQHWGGHRALVPLLSQAVHKLLERLAGFRGPVTGLKHQ